MKELNKILSTLQELRSVIRTLRLNPSEADLREMIKELDTNSKYSTGARECRRDTGTEPISRGPQRDDQTTRHKVLQELGSIIRTLGQNLPTTVLRQMIKELDSNIYLT